MKLIFAHDHIFYKFNNQFYSTGGLSKEMLERYTSVFEEVIVLSRQKEILSYNENLTLASTERVRFVEIPNFKKISDSLKYIKAKKSINYEISNADKVIARLPSSIGSLAVEAAIKNSKPYLIEVVACPWDALWNHSYKGKILAPVKYLSMKKLVRNSKHVTYVTNNFLQKRYPTRGDSVNCSNVALKEINEDTLKKRLIKIEQKTEGKIIIGTTAAINVKYKGQQYVIEALGELKKKGVTNFEYQLVGSGDMSYLKSIAEKNNVLDQIRFLGSLSHDKVFEWLDFIDVYIQPSKQEGLPRGLIEAMSRALPSFGAKTAGIPELLDEKFIFSNSKRNFEEIAFLLERITKESMSLQAKTNFEEAKRYEKKIIEERRRRFFEEFKQEK